MQFNKDDEAVESDLEDELDKLFTKRKRRESNTDYENKALVDSFLAQMEVAVEEDMKDYEQGEWHQPAYSEYCSAGSALQNYVRSVHTSPIVYMPLPPSGAV